MKILKILPSGNAFAQRVALRLSAYVPQYDRSPDFTRLQKSKKQIKKIDRIQSTRSRTYKIKRDAMYRVSTYINWDRTTYLAAAASRSLVSLITVSATLAGQAA